MKAYVLADLCCCVPILMPTECLLVRKIYVFPKRLSLRFCKRFISFLSHKLEIGRYSMSKILVLYYSRSGNTEKMANAVAEGVKSVANTELELEYHVDPDDLNRFEMRVTEPPLLVKYTPDESSLNGCRTFGKRVSESLIQPA